MEKIDVKIKRLLAEFLGIEIEDMTDDDTFEDTYQMSAINITDFFELLEENDIVVPKDSIDEIETVGDLLEIVGDDFVNG